MRIDRGTKEERVARTPKCDQPDLRMALIEGRPKDAAQNGERVRAKNPAIQLHVYDINTVHS